MKIPKLMQAIAEEYGVQVGLVAVFAAFLIALVYLNQITADAAIAALAARVFLSSTIWGKK